VAVADAVVAWLETKRDTVRPITFNTYAFQSSYVVGSLLTGEARRAIIHSRKGAKPTKKPMPLLGREGAGGHDPPHPGVAQADQRRGLHLLREQGDAET
jgi:hypothetical protein